MTGSSAGKAPRRATADTRQLPLCADGCARRFFRLRAAAQPGDLIITVGAGDIYKAGEKLLREN